MRYMDAWLLFQIAVSVWNDNNIVMMAHTTQAQPDEAVTCKRRVGAERLEVPRPKAAADYNKLMNGVDTHDQMRAKYFVFTFVMASCRVNAWILYKEARKPKRKYTQRDFIEDVGKYS